MRLVCVPLLVLFTLACAGITDAAYDFPTERRDLWSGTVGDLHVEVWAELHGHHTPAHLGPDFNTIPAADRFVVLEGFEVSRGGEELPRRHVDSHGAARTDTLFHAEEAKRALAELQASFCPAGDTLVYRVGSAPWTALWPVGPWLLHAPLPDVDGDCDAVIAALPDRFETLARRPGHATTCLALDDAGRRDAAVTCLLTGAHDDLRVEPPMISGMPEPTAWQITRVDDAEIRSRIAADPEAMNTLVTRLLDGEVDLQGDASRVNPVVGLLDQGGRREAFVSALQERCADRARPCPPASLDLANVALRWGASAPSAEVCAAVGALGSTVAARPDAGGIAGAFRLASGYFACDDPAFRALMVAGLGTATSPEAGLRSPDALHYSLVDSNCHPHQLDGVPHLSSQCTSLPRFAGSWLAVHCGPDAVDAAAAIVDAHPKDPFDPRQDQVLDGAMRVLARCEPARFEAAIAHLPDKVIAAANLRSRTAMRAAFEVAPTEPAGVP